MQTGTVVLSNGTMSLTKVLIQAVDMFGERVGFLKFKADVFDEEIGTKVPGIVFARGPTIAVLVLLDSEDESYVILTEQVRVPVGRLILELPAGMLDDDKGDFARTAVREDEGIAPYLYVELDFLEVTRKKAGIIETINQLREKVGETTLISQGDAVEFCISGSSQVHADYAIYFIGCEDPASQPMDQGVNRKIQSQPPNLSTEENQQNHRASSVPMLDANSDGDGQAKINTGEMFDLNMNPQRMHEQASNDQGFGSVEPVGFSVKNYRKTVFLVV